MAGYFASHKQKLNPKRTHPIGLYTTNDKDWQAVIHPLAQKEYGVWQPSMVCDSVIPELLKNVQRVFQVQIKRKT